MPWPTQPGRKRGASDSSRCTGPNRDAYRGGAWGACIGISNAGNLSGLMVVVLITLGPPSVPIQHLLLGGASTGVILGIAAQRALGNIFAGPVLLLARPFNVGDAIRIRSGTLGGELLCQVVAMGLTYITLETAAGPLSVPNSVLLASGIGPQPDRRPTVPG